MADAKITALTENTTPLITDLIPMVDDPAGTPLTQKITMGNLYKSLFAPQGFLINGKIVPSVGSNNLTVAIKGMDGNDPSASNPVYCRIGDTVRVITSALSVTKNAGTNWFNSGASETATIETDYFVYLGYNATDGVVIGFARVPFGTRYDSFSTTTTNDKYCAISTITTASAGDYYQLIGRFGAILSATASFDWSVPTFTAKNLIQYPIFETRWLSFTPSWSAGGSMTVTSPTNPDNVYKITREKVDITFATNATFGGTASNLIYTTPPLVTSITINYNQFLSGAYYLGENRAIYGLFNASATQIAFRKADDTDYALGGAYVFANGFFRIA